MNINNLKCNCGETEQWSVHWSMTDEWQLTLNCENCGAVYIIGHAPDYNAKVKDLIKSSN